MYRWSADKRLELVFQDREKIVRCLVPCLLGTFGTVRGFRCDKHAKHACSLIQVLPSFHARRLRWFRRGLAILDKLKFESSGYLNLSASATHVFRALPATMQFRQLGLSRVDCKTRVHLGSEDKHVVLGQPGLALWNLLL